MGKFTEQVASSVWMMLVLTVEGGSAVRCVGICAKDQLPGNGRLESRFVTCTFTCALGSLTIIVQMTEQYLLRKGLRNKTSFARSPF